MYGDTPSSKPGCSFIVGQKSGDGLVVISQESFRDWDTPKNAPSPGSSSGHQFCRGFTMPSCII